MEALKFIAVATLILFSQNLFAQEQDEYADLPKGQQVHIHLEEGRILSRNGKPPPAHEAGRKDVYVLNPDDEVRVFIRFRDFSGKYMMHCHNTIHEDHAMMIRFDIVE